MKLDELHFCGAEGRKVCRLKDNSSLLIDEVCLIEVEARAIVQQTLDWSPGA